MIEDVGFCPLSGLRMVSKQHLPSNYKALPFPYKGMNYFDSGPGLERDLV